MVIQYLQYLLTGLLISLSGSLPLGNLNVAAMQIAAKHSLNKAVWFAVGVTAIEMMYLRLTLGLLNLLAGYERLFYLFRALTIVLLLVLAVGSFIAARSKAGKHVILDSTGNKLVLGATMSILNPMQVPFWLGWAVYLLSRSLLVATSGVYNIFTAGAGMGTFAALLLFILAGRKFSVFMITHRASVNIAMGCLFGILALFQIVHFL